ncbi:hypothetical protein WISP_143481 [Willisornis vidua]|uniref:Uncharacterized protein n=1 Tax=Willisornis vidua TaxID=1566151 RepID=A0ABQ9CLD3_9PASS|nr:hypothetical protein WISP_143481 [Willisornis vidua]
MGVLRNSTDDDIALVLFITTHKCKETGAVVEDREMNTIHLNFCKAFISVSNNIVVSELQPGWMHSQMANTDRDISTFENRMLMLDGMPAVRVKTELLESEQGGSDPKVQ